MLNNKISGTLLYPVKTVLSIIAICNLLLTACVNDLPDEKTKPGDVPIKIETSIKSIISRVSNDEFEADDAIGLYITVLPATIEKNRYIDNMKCYYDLSNDFLPEEKVYYPEGENECLFIGYYPYNKNAIRNGESAMNVEVKTDQSTEDAFSASNFMVATASEATPSTDPIALDFKHKLSQLNIRLTPESGYTVEMLLASNPTVKVKNVYTKATYDLGTGKFSNHNSKEDIIPYGDWRIEDGVLCGKSAIIIPQTLPKSHIALELYVDDRLFECIMLNEHTFESGIAEKNTITLQSSVDAVKATVHSRISEWTTKETAWKANETTTVLHTSLLDFEKHNVLKVVNKEKKVAEICLEYLVINETGHQAVVIYPMMENGKADLTKGQVIELKGETADKHGGKVSWNTSTHSLTYTEGTSPIIPYIYINKEGEIRTARPVDALQLQVRPDLFVDSRGEEKIEYGITKVGTQYWTRILKTLKYTDGSDIAHGGTNSENATVSNSAPQYYDYRNGYFYYNANCVGTGNLTPNGWRVGNETDYKQLKTYIQNNAAVLKNGNSWKSSSHPVTNLTGFYAAATGYFNKTYGKFENEAAYWCASDQVKNQVEKIVVLSVANNEMTINNAIIADMALPIRFVRE